MFFVSLTKFEHLKMRAVLTKDRFKVSYGQCRDDNCSQLSLLASFPLLLCHQLARVLLAAVENVPDQVQGGQGGRRGGLPPPGEPQAGAVHLLQLLVHVHREYFLVPGNFHCYPWSGCVGNYENAVARQLVLDREEGLLAVDLLVDEVLQLPVDDHLVLRCGPGAGSNRINQHQGISLCYIWIKTSQELRMLSRLLSVY